MHQRLVALFAIIDLLLCFASAMSLVAVLVVAVSFMVVATVVVAIATVVVAIALSSLLRPSCRLLLPSSRLLRPSSRLLGIMSGSTYCRWYLAECPLSHECTSQSWSRAKGCSSWTSVSAIAVLDVVAHCLCYQRLVAHGNCSRSCSARSSGPLLVLPATCRLWKLQRQM